MSREEIKEHIMNYIDYNVSNDFIEDRIDIVLRILYEIEANLDYQNETIDKVIDLLQNEPIFH